MEECSILIVVTARDDSREVHRVDKSTHSVIELLRREIAMFVEDFAGDSLDDVERRKFVVADVFHEGDLMLEVSMMNGIVLLLMVNCNIPGRREDLQTQVQSEEREASSEEPCPSSTPILQARSYQARKVRESKTKAR